MDDQMRIEDYVYGNVTVCEMLFGQPEAYYWHLVERGKIRPIRFDRYHVLITGLSRQIYRTFFGIDAFEYTDYFRETRREIEQLLAAQNVECLTAMLLYDHSKRFAMIFSTPEHVSADDVAQIVSSCFNRLYARIFDMSRIPYRNYTVLSDEIHGYENLTKTFQEIDMLSRQQFFDMRTMIMTPKLLEESIVPVSREQIHEDIMLLRTALRERDKQEAERAFGSLFDHLRGARDFDLLSGALHAIRSMADGMLASCGWEVDDPETFSIEHYPTFDHLREGLRQGMLGLIASMQDGPAMSAPVLEAVRYIRHHFREDVALADVAKHIDMSPSWLTKHFNRECGMSIPQYLLSVRMERAQRLFLETNMLVFEVADAVGFDNPRYFVSVFKKETGMTPKAFREQARKE